jgi:hypothetical protein
MVERLRFSMAKSVTTDEAKDTCEAAAAPAAPATRQTASYAAAAVPAEGGQWQIVRNRAGECGHVLYST